MGSTVRGDLVCYRTLHPGIGHDDEVSGEPRADEDHDRGEEVHPLAKSLLSKEKDPQERGFKKKCKDAFHGESSCYDAAGMLGKTSPIRPELKLHRNSGHHTEKKIYRKDPGPKPRGVVEDFVPFPKVKRLEDDDEWSESHR